MPEKRYENIELPRNTGMGIYISAFAFAFGFAIVWHILWLALLGPRRRHRLHRRPIFERAYRI